MRLCNVFAFSDPEALTIKVLYGISGQFGLCSFMSSFVL